MPVIRDLKTFRQKYSTVKTGAEAARRNGVSTQVLWSLENEEGFRGLSLFTLLRYFRALDAEVGILSRAADRSVHELDMSADFDHEHAKLLDNIEKATGVRLKRPKKVTAKASTDDARGPAAREEEGDPTKQGSEPAGSASAYEIDPDSWLWPKRP